MNFLTIFCGTWNVNGKEVKEDLSPWLVPQNGQIPDLFVLGFQEFDLTRESFMKFDEKRLEKWDQAILSSINKIDSYKQVARQQLVGMLIIVYCKSQIADEIKDIDSDLVGTGYEGVFGNKGGVGVRFRFGNDTFCFINSHLNAHTHNVDRRKNDYDSLISRLVFNPQKKGGSNKKQEERSLPPDMTTDDRGEESAQEKAPVLTERLLEDGDLTLFDHHHLVWLGDLNYRVDLPRETIIDAVSRRDWEVLLKEDQLKSEIKKGRVFEGFDEAPLDFAPTYKFDSGTDNYDSSRKMRAPAFCDRILWKSSQIVSLSYSAHFELKVSDHKPVSSLLKVALKPTEEKKVKNPPSSSPSSKVSPPPTPKVSPSSSSSSSSSSFFGLGAFLVFAALAGAFYLWRKSD